MKGKRRWLLLWSLTLWSILLVTGAGAEAARSLPSYSEIRQTYAHPPYEGEPLRQTLNLSLARGDEAELLLTVPEDGQYELWLDYQNQGASILPTELSVLVDGRVLFRELSSVQLRSEWIDDGVFPVDRYGNELPAEPYQAQKVLRAALTDSSGRTADPFLFDLTAGEHRLTLKMIDGAATLSAVALQARAEAPSRQTGDSAGDGLIVIEGERIYSRNDSGIRSAAAYITSLSPYDASRRLQNHLSGESFSWAGAVATYRVEAEEAGWYRFGAFYSQTARSGFPVYADILLDGALPCAAARAVPFDYSEDFRLMTAGTAEEPLRVYLSEGEHLLSLRINAERLTPVFELIDRLNGEINELSQEIIRLTGGVSSDRYRSYNLLSFMPELPDRLRGWAQECEELLQSMTASSPDATAFSYLALSAAQLRALAEKPEELPRRLGELSTGSNSVSKYLSQLLSDLSRNDLSIDQLYLYQDDAALPEKPGAMQAFAMDVSRFFGSFNQRSYAIGRGDARNLQVWMCESRAFVETLQSLIDTDFTPKTGVTVDLSIMSTESKLVLSNAAGNAPDVALSMGLITPSYLDVRGALMDLTAFPDFPEVAERFNENLFLPFLYDDGVYALPQQVNFWVLFYRKDILDSLGLAVPDTLEDVKQMLPTLQTYGMNFFYPTAGMGGMKTFDGTLPLIMQSGGSIYGDALGATTLDSEEALAGFRELTELFTIYALPVDSGSGFYQRFRDGTMPIGISNLWTYNTLANAAPELNGLWDIAVIPGLRDAEGSVSRWTTGTMKGMGIMAGTDMPEEAWAFLKWWSSAETQSAYANMMFRTYGQDCLWTSANSEAFSRLPIKSSHKEVILEQMRWMKDAPWCLGTYMVERELSNAFLSVVVDGMDARRALDMAVKRIDRETFRKLEEFGYYKDGEMVRTYKTPDAALIERLIRAPR